MNIKKIEEQLNDYEVISFDIYDTLVNRCVGSPRKIFSIIEKVLCEKYGDEYSGFATKRIEAERQALYFSDKEEISLTDIYNRLNMNRKDMVFQLEEDTEIELSVANIEMFKLYQECINRKKRVVICSDMYLDVEIVKKILEKNYYIGYEQLYLSSDRNKRKSTGALFKELIIETGVLPEKIFHIGDNYKSDCLCAKKEGIRAFHYFPVKRYEENYTYPYNIFYGDMPKEFLKDFYWEQVGKYSLGNFLFGFTKWLISKLEAGHYDHVFFLSRDGFIMQKAMEIMASKELINKSSYLYASRRSLIVPALHLYDSYKERCAIMFWKKHYSIKEFVSNFGVEYEDYKEKIEKFIKNPDYVYERDELFSNTELISIYKCLEQMIEENSKKEYELLIQYLKQEGFEGNVAIVDTGWFGNLQNAIEKNISVARVNAKVHGYYIGIRDKCKYFENQAMSAYLYYGQEHMHNQINEIRATAVVEAFFSHNECSTKCFKKENGSIVPVLQNNHSDNKKCDILNTLQKSALDRVKQLNMLKNINVQYYDPEVYFYGFYRIGIRPTLFDAWEIARFVENVDIHGTGYYLKHPNRIKKDIHELNWKLGQLKRVLRLKLDYMKVYALFDR